MRGDDRRRDERARPGGGSHPGSGGLLPGARGLALALGLAAALGCAGGLIGEQGAFQRLFDQGRYRAAIDTFQADSSLQRQEGPLFRVGLVYADPGDTIYDPERAGDLLTRLLELHPETEYRHQARALLELLRRAREADERAARLQEQLQRLKEVHLGRPPDTSSVPRP